MKIALCIVASILLAPWVGTTVGLTPVTISHQGAVLWALPLYIAQQEGYFSEQDLNVTFVVYPSGAPQVAAAVDDAAWDIGAAGVVPNIIGGLNGIDTIGISNDESATNALVANAAGAMLWPPDSIDQTPIAVTPNSTGLYAVEACLMQEGFDPTEASYVYSQQAGVIEALEQGTTEYGGLWAPNLYTFQEDNEGSEIICSGKSANATVPGGIMIRREFFQTPGANQTVSKVLACWLRAIEYINDDDNRVQVLSYMMAFYLEYGVILAMQDLEKDIDSRPLFGLDEQLRLMQRQDGAPSIVDSWYDDVASFLLQNGVLSTLPVTTDYITNDFMTALYDDPALRAYATFGVPPSEAPSSSPTSPPTSSSKGNFERSKLFYFGASGLAAAALLIM